MWARWALPTSPLRRLRLVLIFPLLLLLPHSYETERKDKHRATRQRIGGGGGHTRLPSLGRRQRHERAPTSRHLTIPSSRKKAMCDSVPSFTAALQLSRDARGVGTIRAWGVALVLAEAEHNGLPPPPPRPLLVVTWHFFCTRTRSTDDGRLTRFGGSYDDDDGGQGQGRYRNLGSAKQLPSQNGWFLWFLSIFEKILS